MFVRVTSRSVDLEEAADFGRFSVLRWGDAELPANWRTTDGGHVFIPRDDIVALAGDLADEQWQKGFAGMLGYASSKGWVDEGGAVRAHIEQGE